MDLISPVIGLLGKAVEKARNGVTGRASGDPFDRRWSNNVRATTHVI